MSKVYDFSGWATRNDLKCSDGRTIRRDAFKDNDGATVPLVWNHQHNDAENVLGHALLENRDQGVYAYCTFNDTEKGQIAKNLVKHGDVTALSIYANKLKQVGGDVLHGAIREVSLVLAGANPGAFIDSVLAHGEESDEEAIIYTGENLELEHACGGGSDKEEPESKSEPDPKAEEKPEETKEEKKVAEKTVQDVVDSMTEEQKNVMYAIVGMAVEDAKKGGGANEEENMKHNVFDEDEEYSGNVLTHSDMEEIIGDAKRCGSMKEAFLAHGIDNIDYLFPDNRNLSDKPGFINTIPNGWVTKVMNGVHHTPFSRIKMMFADITMDTARAKGYVKGNFKTDEQFSLLKRTVNPTTVYKKQKLDRDDVVDITDFDVITWLKGEMRTKLDEEIARAILFGDGRSASDDDKISETNIIPVIKDTTNNLYAISKTVTVPAGTAEGTALIDTVVKSMDEYEGSGNTVAFIRNDKVSDMILLKDADGYRMYKNLSELADAMTVNSIEKVPASIVPDGFYGVILDLNDYNVGADKGGAVNMFDDFDIDYNAQKYLIETRCSGALTKPHSAIVLAVAGD